MVNLDSGFLGSTFFSFFTLEALCTLAVLIPRRRRKKKTLNILHCRLRSQSKMVFGGESEAFQLSNGDCGRMGVLSICHNDHSDNHSGQIHRPCLRLKYLNSFTSSLYLSLVGGIGP